MTNFYKTDTSHLPNHSAWTGVAWARWQDWEDVQVWENNIKRREGRGITNFWYILFCFVLFSFRGGKICLTVHFKPLWARNVPHFGIAHALALGVCSPLSSRLSSTPPPSSTLLHSPRLSSFVPFIHLLLAVFDFLLTSQLRHAHSLALGVCLLFLSYFYSSTLLLLLLSILFIPLALSVKRDIDHALALGIIYCLFSQLSEFSILSIFSILFVTSSLLISPLLLFCPSPISFLSLPFFSFSLLQLAPWLAAEVPHLVDTGMITHPEAKSK